MSRISKQEKIEALTAQVQALADDIADIEYRRKTELNRAHPSQEYIDGLKFELRSFRAQLEKLQQEKGLNRTKTPTENNVVPLRSPPREP